jgi:hypothetical protein
LTRKLRLENKNNKEIMTSQSVKLETLEGDLKIKKDDNEHLSVEMKNNLMVFTNLIDKEKKIGEVYKS